MTALPQSSIRLLAAIHANPGLNLTHAGATVGLAKEQSHERARALVRDGLLLRRGEPRRPVFTLTKKAVALVHSAAKAARRCPACGQRTQ